MRATFQRRWYRFILATLGGTTAVLLVTGGSATTQIRTRIILEKVATGLSHPVHLTHASDGSGRLFIVEQEGSIRVARAGELLPTPFLDISGLVRSGGERGLLSVAFHPQYATNGLFYVNYTDTSGDTVVARYSVSANPDRADAATGVVLLTIPQPYSNHNGGQLQFGPDGYLYIGMGDGGAGPGPPLDEIWALGLRNPWRFSFDRRTGDLYIADVGQDAFEEIDVQPAGSRGGENYGWNIMEGTHCFSPPTGCRQAGLTMPVATYRTGENCAITGGYVYRGTRVQTLIGTYVFGDYCSGRIWGLRKSNRGGWTYTELLNTDLQITSFGEEEAGELYVADHRGAIYRVSPLPGP